MLPGIARKLRQPRADLNTQQRRGPATRFNRRVGTQRIYDAREYALKDLSAMRKAVPRATVNDVILALCSGAIHHYLKAKRELPPESLLVMAPINTRSENERSAAGGNQVSLMTLPLCTDIADPLQRLRRIAQHTAQAKETVNSIGAREITDLNKSTPAATMALAFRLVTGANLLGSLRAFNTVVSNVPGPQVPIYLCGARLLSWSGLGPCSHGLGFGFPVLSYNGKVNFAFNGCAKAVPDVDFAVECLERAFTELKDAAAQAQSSNGDVHV
jgi:WS/DGAT/MGAT family acyltransferase